jgi:tRNA pseudouridine55 synthase
MNAAFLVVDKAPGMTSHDVVALVRAVTGIKKVGHTGTLDPFATGVLVLALGKATRFIQFLDERLKVYDATIQLGWSTTTGDPEGEELERSPVPTLENIEEVLEGFVGKQMQTPPAYSAVKVAGKALYKYARSGEKVEAKPREIEIYSVRLIEAKEETIRVEIRCSRGTYARVLAEDIAVKFGTHGHLVELRRLQSGPFEIDQAIDMPGLGVIAAGMSDWTKAFSREGERVKWLPREEVCKQLFVRSQTLAEALSHMPLAPVSSIERAKVLRGDVVPAPPSSVEEGGRYLAIMDQEVLSVAERVGSGGKVLRALGAPESKKRRHRR